ncbi:MAG: tyrosine-protein kinase [Actinomycetota bacterium]|nr:tyrosine-protein kinase [Actinomycetota bacterium]
MPPMDESNGTDLRKYVQILRRRWPLILLVVAATGVSAYLVSARMKPTYRGATEVQVQPIMGASQSQELLNLFQNPTLVLQTDVKLIESDSVLGLAAKDLGLTSTKSLKRSLNVQLIPNTQILEVDVDTQSPMRSREWANRIAESFIAFQRTQAIAQVTAANTEAINRVAAANADIAQRLDALKGQILAAQRSSISSTVIAGLTAQQTALASAQQPLPAAATLGSGGPSVIVPATTPLLPIRPKIRQNVLLGGMLGMFLAAGLVLLGEALDDRLRTGEEVEGWAGAPTLGFVPYTKELAGKDASPAVVHDSSSVVAEAYRTVRTNLRFLSVERPIKSLLVTSSVKGEGKSTTAANLAAAFALSGVKTILISADLRRPTVHKFFGLPNSEGLVDALLPDAQLEPLLQCNELPDFRFLAAGRIPPNPAEILSSSRFGDILSTLEAAADLVIIDSTPLLGVADASALASRVDGVVLVVNPREVNRRTLVLATEQLRKAGGRALGTILNAVSSGQGYGYGYDYDYYYYTADKDKKKNRKARKSGDAHAFSPAGNGVEERLAMTWGGDAKPGQREQAGGQLVSKAAAQSLPPPDGANSGAAGTSNLRIWDAPDGAPLGDVKRTADHES